MKVYVVQSGECEDVDIHGVFSTEDKAKKRVEDLKLLQFQRPRYFEVTMDEAI